MKLDDYRPMMARCSNCNGCKWLPFDKVQSLRFGENCPSVCYYNFNTYSARGRFMMARAILEGDAEYTEKATEVVHSCVSCGACDMGCKICRYNIEPLEHSMALKADAVQKGKTLPAQAPLIESLRKEHTMLPGMKKQDRASWADGLKLKNALEETADILFFPGCKYSHDPRLAGKAADMVKVLQKAGVTVGTLGKADSCCAARAWQMGFTDDFNRAAKANILAIQKSGVKTVVTPCSDCYHGVKRLYAPLGLSMEVLHYVEYLDRLIAEGTLRFTRRVEKTVTYHDPCHLGRQGEAYVPWDGTEKKVRKQIHTWSPRRPRYNGIYGIYDAPRRVLAAIPGLTLHEMERNRENSWCCGAGGGCGETLPDFANWTAGERSEEAVAVGAQSIVTACPWCEHTLRGPAEERGMTVCDLFDLVRDAI